MLSSSPGLQAVVAGPDLDLWIRFNSRIDHHRSRLTLIGPDGGQSETAQVLTLANVDEPDLLSARATGLAAGSYRLRWQVLAVDGHITRGEIPFTIGRP